MFWVTKYALTGGIEVVDGEVSEKYPDMISAKSRTGNRHFHKPDWYTSETEAIERAEKMRIDKIASLERQIEKLKRKKF